MSGQERVKFQNCCDKEEDYTHPGQPGTGEVFGEPITDGYSQRANANSECKLLVIAGETKQGQQR